MKHAGFFILLLLLMTLVVAGQNDRPGSIQRQSGITLNSAEIAGREELTKHAPYLATAIVESTQMLADGNRILHNTQELVARDGEGRTRHEEVFDRIGSLEVHERQNSHSTAADRHRSASEYAPGPRRETKRLDRKIK